MRRLTILLLSLMALAACHNDDIGGLQPVSPTGLTVTIEGDTLLSRNASYESITLNINERGDDDTVLRVSCDADWVKLYTDTLPGDGIVVMQTSTNNETSRRQATLNIVSASNDKHRTTVTLTQLCEADNDQNGSDARHVLYIGYGYNIYQSLDDTLAVRTTEPILKYVDLINSGGTNIYEVLHDAHLARTEIKYVASRTIHNYAEDLTQQQTSNTLNIIGCRGNCLTTEQIIRQGNLFQQNFGHGSMVKTVASRVIDRGALADLHLRDKMPFTRAFETALRKVLYGDASQRKQLISQMLVRFGTHLIIQVDLGGRIDYSFTMQKNSTLDSSDELRQEVNYTFARITSSELSTNHHNGTSSSKSASGAITVRGGSPATRRQLEADIKGLSPSGQITPDHLTDWLATINYSEALDADPALDVIHFELLPLWDIVPDQVRQDFIDATLSMADRSDCRLPDRLFGTDIYEIDATRADLTSFTDDDRSLCRILYLGGQPVVEVCSEYVPKIRTDRRVTVVYPIYQNTIRLNQGVFLGDGIHQPAYVGFSGADSYVSPISYMAPGERMTRFYYINGNLHPNCEAGSAVNEDRRQRQVRDDNFIYYYNSEYHSTPVVKIGANFWTRRDIAHPMGFTDEPDNDENVSDYLNHDGTLFTRYYLRPYNDAAEANSMLFGFRPQGTLFTDNNTRWYMPDTQHVRWLYQYLGRTPKALFRGQISGFNALFNGYFGNVNLQTGQRLDDQEQLDAGHLNVLATRCDDSHPTACLLVLDNNYTLRLVDDSTFGDDRWRENYYPVRLCRGANFEYPSLSDMDEMK